MTSVWDTPLVVDPFPDDEESPPAQKVNVVRHTLVSATKGVMVAGMNPKIFDEQHLRRNVKWNDQYSPTTSSSGGIGSRSTRKSVHWVDTVDNARGGGSTPRPLHTEALIECGHNEIRGDEPTPLWRLRQTYGGLLPSELGEDTEHITRVREPQFPWYIACACEPRDCGLEIIECSTREMHMVPPFPPPGCKHAYIR